MPLTLGSIVIDCEELEPLAEFWAAALGYERQGTWPSWIWLGDPAGAGPRLGLQKVDRVSPGKNRVHFDLYCGDLEAEVERLTALGGTLLRRNRIGATDWCVLADPAGNEFCVVCRG